ncbi:DMT family transporter [Sutterella sp.]|uniref:DMT family transporter n=1 Tax=Sutterella sp. TaxID=1981025 RepID=UPI0026E05C0D|nr:DMT family transporter [Sutterella sp.]MDO5532904.1 DMT family transporter [Sutterella sp.]
MHSSLAFELRQSALLLLTALIWGCTFVAQSVGMGSVGPFTFTSSRMILGVLFLLPIVTILRKRLATTKPAEADRRRSREYTRTLLLGGFLCGLCLFGGELLQQMGFVHDTEVGKAGFITALYIVFVPLIGMLLGQRSRLLLWIAVVIAVAGLWFLCIPPEGFSIATGDIYVFACAIVFALHILVISRFVTRVDGIELSMMQFFFGSIIAATMMMLFEHPTVEGWTAALPAILWAGIMSNGIAYTLQIVGQRGMNDTAASLILSLESVVSVLAGWVLLDEILSTREIIGCVLMAAAVVLAQLPERKKS